MAFNSLKKKKDFTFVFKKGKALKHDFLFLKAAFNDLDKTRFGIIVSQKVAKKAVVRNRVRRRIRAALQKLLPQVKPGLDVIISTLPHSVFKDFQEIEEALKTAFAKAGLTNSKNGIIG